MFDADAWLPLGFYDDAALWDDNLLWSDLVRVEQLLPVNATPAEVAIEAATARIADVPLPIRDLLVPDACPEPVLPWLAWSLSVDEWFSSWPVDRRRAVVASSAEVHRRKGTRFAVVQAIAAAGLGDAELLEHDAPELYDGVILHDGSVTHVTEDHWAEYTVVLTRPMSIAQAAQARRIIEAVAPLRCHLKALEFTEASNLYAATITHNGAFTHGVA